VHANTECLSGLVELLGDGSSVVPFLVVLGRAVVMHVVQE